MALGAANPKLYLKAITGGVLAGLGVLFVALNDGSVSAQEWVEVAQGALVAGAAVYGIPNLGPAAPAQPAPPVVNPIA